MPRNPNKIDYSGGLPESFSAFQLIEDKRTGGNKKHHFGEVLFMVVVGLLCGMDGFAAIEQFCKNERTLKWLRKWITLPHGVPRAQTFSNIFQLIEPDQFQRCLIAHVCQISPALKAKFIAIDGKALQGSREFQKAAAHAVSAWAVDEGLTLAQEFVSEKSNEITALPKLLDLLDLEGSIVTIDAMGSQVGIARKLDESGAGYVLPAKGNQGNTFKEVTDFFEIALRQLDLATAKGWTHHEDIEKSHRQLTKRTVLACQNLGTFDLEIRNRWAGLESIFVVGIETTLLPGGKQHQREQHYYLSNEKLSAEEFGKIARNHWAVENPCHWVLDVTFREDASQIRKGHAPKNMGTARRIALNLLKADQSFKGTLPAKRRQALFDEAYREGLLSLATTPTPGEVDLSASRAAKARRTRSERLLLIRKINRLHFIPLRRNNSASMS